MDRAVRRHSRSTHRTPHGLVVGRGLVDPVRHDPDQANYPDLYRLFIPPELWGKYDVPGGPLTASSRTASRWIRLPLMGCSSTGLLPGPAWHPIDGRQRTERQRSVERAVRDDPRRRTHLHLDAFTDRRSPPATVAGSAHWVSLREHQGLAVLTGRSWPRSEAARQPTRH